MVRKVRHLSGVAALIGLAVFAPVHARAQLVLTAQGVADGFTLSTYATGVGGSNYSFLAAAPLPGDGPAAVPPVPSGIIHPGEVRPGMEVTAYTIFAGASIEAFHGRVLGVARNFLGPSRDVVLLNAGAGLMIAGVAASVGDGILIASRAIDRGDARRTLDQLAAISTAGEFAEGAPA